MRFAFALYRYFPHGGLQCDMLRIAQEAARRGHEVWLFVHEWRGAMPEPALRVCKIPASGFSNHAKMASFGRNFQQEKEKYGPFDASVCFSRISGGDFYFAADNCLAVEWKEKHAPWCLKLLPRYRNFLTQEAGVCRDPRCRIFYITPRQKLQYQLAYQLPEERFLFLPPGMNPACRRPENAEEIRKITREKLNLSGQEELMLILVGSDFRRKGGDRAIRAVASLPEELRKRIRFFLVGNCSPGCCRKLPAQLGLAGQVIFTGGRTDVPELLLAADLMVHPARSESAGSVLIEALAAGLPVIASGACGFADYVAQNDPMLVVPEPFEQSALNKCLYDALTHLDKLKQRTCTYGAAADFYRRAAVAADELEKFVREKKLKA